MTDVRMDEQRRGRWLVLVVGIGYLLLVAFSDWILVFVVGLPVEADVATLRRQGNTYELLQTATIGLPPALVLWWVATRDVGRELRTALQLRGGLASFAVAAVITMVIRLLLAATGLWPFEWQWPESSTPVKFLAFLEGRQHLAIGSWVVEAILLVPFVEEATFRFALLRVATTASGSAAVGVVLSALVFAALHIPWFPGEEGLQTFHFVDATFLFATFLLVGKIAVQNRGNIVLPIVIHAAINGAGLAFLAWAFVRYG